MNNYYTRREQALQRAEQALQRAERAARRAARAEGRELPIVQPPPAPPAPRELPIVQQPPAPRTNGSARVARMARIHPRRTAPAPAPAPAPVALLPFSMTKSEIKNLPVFIPKDTDELMNGLLLGPFNNDDVLAFLKSDNKIIDDNRIIVYTANGKKTEAVDHIFNKANPTNPFTRQPLKKEDIVLMRVKIPGRSCIDGRCTVMGGRKTFKKRKVHRRKAAKTRKHKK